MHHNPPGIADISQIPAAEPIAHGRWRGEAPNATSYPSHHPTSIMARRNASHNRQAPKRVGRLRQIVDPDLRARDVASAATRSRCGRSRPTAGRSETTSARSGVGAVGPEAMKAARPPDLRIANQQVATSPPTVSRIASQSPRSGRCFQVRRAGVC